VKGAGDELATFQRELAAGRRNWTGLALPWNTDLRGMHLSDCDLSGAALRGAVLDGVLLDGCKLVEADLRKASLRGAVLVRADLRGANLRGADLRNANLTKADLCEADLVACDMRGARMDAMAVSFACKTFAGVKLSGAMVRHVYSLLLTTRPDDPEVVRALESMRSVLEVPLDERIPLDEDDNG
jgi:uncharacterized protein YjbI with pentapeptide repeats